MSATSMKVLGIKETFAAMEQYKASGQRRILRTGLATAGKVANKLMKSAVGEDMKPLRKSIGRRKKTYAKTGTVIEVIGPRFAYVDPKTGLRPSAGASDVEFGTNKQPQRSFARKSLHSHGSQWKRLIVEGMRDGLQKEAVRAARKAARV